MKIIQNIFCLVLKFCSQLSYLSWEENPDTGEITHPNFVAMTKSYNSFKQHFLFLFNGKFVHLYSCVSMQFFCSCYAKMLIRLNILFLILGLAHFWLISVINHSAVFVSCFGSKWIVARSTSPLPNIHSRNGIIRRSIFGATFPATMSPFTTLFVVVDIYCPLVGERSHPAIWQHVFDQFCSLVDGISMW